jgi:SNF2 family DNA or RNA helicase
MLKQSDMTKDQNGAVTHIYENNSTLLVADMGAGKTVVALTAAQELLQEGFLTRVLVVSTIKVAKNVWPAEIKKWEHLKRLNVALALGAIGDREKAMASGAEIVVINFENLQWFAAQYRSCMGGFDGLIIDEVSKLKSNSGSNFKAIRNRVKDFKWRLTMTGTPVSEDWTGLFAEMFITDGGVALGKNKQKYLDAHFYPTDYERRKWAVLPGQDEEIMKKIKPFIFHLPDYRHELPELKEHIIKIKMHPHNRIMYDTFKRDMVADWTDEETTAPNSAALTGKLQQICQGFTYANDKAKTVSLMHLDKLAHLKRMILPSGIDGVVYKPTIIVYWFKEDLKQLQKAFKHGVVLDGPDSIDAWNRGDIDILFLQPRSAGHGLNLAQGGCDMIFYSQVWSNDLSKQTIARIWRRGQTKQVNVYHLVMEDTVDELMVARIEFKEKYHALLLKHISGDTL